MKPLVYALRCLTRKSYASSELKAKLLLKGFEEEADSVIEKLQQDGYLNDALWLESFLSQQVAKRRGPHFISQQLKAKGFSKEEVEAATRALSNDSLEDSMQIWLEKRFSKADFSDVKTRHKAFQTLARRGFSFPDIQEAIQKFHKSKGSSISA